MNKPYTATEIVLRGALLGYEVPDDVIYDIVDKLQEVRDKLLDSPLMD